MHTADQLEREAIDAEIALMAHDREYQALSRELAEEAAPAHWEALLEFELTLAGGCGMLTLSRD